MKSADPVVFLILTAILAFTFPKGLDAAVLPLADYLGQVERSDPGYQGMIQESSAARTVSDRALLLFRPQFFTQLQFIDDTRDTQAPSIQGTSAIKRNVSAGVREQTPWGLGVQVSFELNQSNVFNTDPTLVARPNLTNTYVAPAFTFSLWQNLFGAADRANQRIMEAEELATAYGKSFEAKAALVAAEGRYWKLAIAREALRVQEESFKRAKAILEFDSKKVQSHLVDPSDLLLSRAAVKGKELELRSLEDEVREAARAFNNGRALDADDVSEQLEIPDPRSLLDLTAPARGSQRGDVAAAEQEAAAKAAGSELAREKLLPELSVYGSIYAWGLNFSVPLDVWTTSSIRTGYQQKAMASELAFQKKAMDEDGEWKGLLRKFSDAKERMSVALELEDIQREKFESVRKRRTRGLTIEDQVFQYELDYLNASLARVQIEGAILGVRAQMKLFGGTQ